MKSPSLPERLAYAFSARNRRLKYAEFLAAIKPAPEETIVDVGVNTVEYSATDNYLEKHYPYPERLTAVTLDDPAPFQARYPAVKVVKADGTALPFGEKSFDVAYSNAVIEHVGPYQAQLAFLSELARVAGRGYLTTPNRHFPIEVHTRIPLLHLILPKSAFDQVLRFIGKAWASGDYMYLLSRKDLLALAEAAGLPNYRLSAKRLFGFPLTYTLIWHTR